MSMKVLWPLYFLRVGGGGA